MRPHRGAVEVEPLSTLAAAAAGAVGVVGLMWWWWSRLHVPNSPSHRGAGKVP